MNKKTGMTIFLTTALFFMIMLSNCAPAVEEEKEKKIDFITNPTEQYFIFVDINNGTNGTAGTKAAPVDDIMEGIGLAQSAGKDVCVAQGFYNVDSSLAVPTNIIMVEGVSIYGGYLNESGVWTRDLETYTSVIHDLNTADSGTILSAVRCNPGITRSTVIDGFWIISGYGTAAVAICCIEGSPVISNNLISGYMGANSGTQNCGIYCSSGSPVIRNNTIYGGTRHGISIGVALSGSTDAEILNNEIYGSIDDSTGINYSIGINCVSSTAKIKGNNISGGDNSLISYGINLDSSNPDIDDNDIDGGLNSSGLSAGINCNFSSNPTISNNTINGGTGSVSTSYGIICDNESEPVITSNTINGGDSLNLACGIHCTEGSNPDISNNAITGGISGNSIYGILCHDASSPALYRNQITIVGDGGVCIQLEDGSCPEIIQNTLTGGSGEFKYGIFEEDDASEPVSVTNNSFSTTFNSVTNSYLYRDFSGGVAHLITTMTDLNGIDEAGYNPAGTVSGNKYIK